MTIFMDMGSPNSKPIVPRRDERYKTLGMSCPLGQIVNLSASGMRICTDGKPDIAKGDAKQFVLRTSRQKLTVTGSVVWIRKRNLLSKQYNIGIRFTDKRGGTREALVAFAKYGFVGNGTNAISCSGGSSRPAARASVIVENHYKVLGIDRGANQREIRRAFWALAKANHPDNNPEPSAEVKFRKINEANEVLGDPAKRRRFDQLLLSEMNAA